MKDFIVEFFSNLKNVIKDLTSKDKEKVKKQIPNLLTLIRGIIAPIIIIQSMIWNNLYLTFLLISTCALTDCIDGRYARKYNSTSEFGALLDTICDKIFTFVIIIPVISISSKYLISILVLELIISIINTFSKLKGNITKSCTVGKAKTVILYITISLYYLNLIVDIQNSILKYLSLYINFMQVITIVEYYKSFKMQKMFERKGLKK